MGCSNMCSTHPDCKAWEYDTNTKCVLKTAGDGVQATYVANDDPSMETYAGLNSGSAGCVRPANKICPMGKYKWVDGVTEDHMCEPCPTGTTTTHLPNHAYTATSAAA